MELFDYEKKHLDFVRETLGECVVLLKSDGNFPLDKPCKIVAYGNGVRKTIKGGTGSGEVNSRYFINIEDGLKNNGFELKSTFWSDTYERLYVEPRKKFINKLKAEARQKKILSFVYSMGKPMPEFEHDIPLDGEGDVAIYVLARISGEGNDRSPIEGDVKLTKSEIRDILFLNEKYEKFMLVINTGGVVDLSPVKDVKNILLLSQLGVDTGNALCDILLGKTNPSGKLTTTWSAWEDYCKQGTFGDHNDTYYNEGIYVGYRYFDTVGKKALFPFGYGLSYTSFKIDNYDVNLNGFTINVSCNVENTGNYPGKEVVQVYLSSPVGKLDKPYQELAGYTKTKLLQSNEKDNVNISFDIRDFTSFDEERCAYILEAGKYLIRVGNSSVNTSIEAVIELDKEVIVRQVKSCCGDPGFKDYRPEINYKNEAIDNVKVLKLDSSKFVTEVINYDHEYEIDDEVKKLSDDELLLASIGGFNPKGGLTSIIGSASSIVPGAAGELSGVYKKLNVKPLIMADGPAGLRITPEYYRDSKGVHGLGQSFIPENVLELMPRFLSAILRLFTGKKKAPDNVKIEYQYCTAIPIGSAIAQSFNDKLAQEYGDIVGDEMERFNIDLWLAPALNIHRSILCGRNFEYFSEDPLISGKMAAAITRGVQAHSGKCTTIKHYAVNNQENNRYGSNSRVSQRALREIYLKGFEICIRESKPLALMTSYNLLNGIHTAESRDLIEDILRREYGYESIVMTDWFAAGGLLFSRNNIYPNIKPENVAAAGGDLFMPGSKNDFKKMKKGLNNGSLTREQLMINVTRVYRLAKQISKI